MHLFEFLEDIHHRPEPFERYTAADLWTDDHISEEMLAHHLDGESDLSSRRAEFIDQSVAWIGTRFDVGPGTRIADFGCGPGLYANRLGRLGADVTGIDFSKRSIEHARAVADKEGLSATYVHQNYLGFETEDRFDLVLLIMCDFCALSPQQRRTMLERFRDLLAPGGSILLDVYSMSAFEQREEAATCEESRGDGFWSAEKHYCSRNTFKYADIGVVLDKYTIVEAKRTRTIYNWYQHFSPQSLEHEFEEAGFTRHEIYGDVAGAPFDASAPEFAIAATR